MIRVAKDLNSCYSHFDVHDFSKEVNEIKRSCSGKDNDMVSSEGVVLEVFKAINAGKI